jgi:ribonuclease HII
MLVGLDEAGAGPVLGSLWAAAVHLPPALSSSPLVASLADSKKLTPKRRAALRAALLAPEQGVVYGLGEVTQAEIDAGGMGEARRLVFERALDDLVARFPDADPPTRLIVDGTLFRPWRSVPHECVPKADTLYPCVMAASVLAKTSRDLQVEAWCDADPTLDARYGLRSNKGYLSARHLEGLRAHGLSALHRASFHLRGL